MQIEAPTLPMRACPFRFSLYLLCLSLLMVIWHLFRCLFFSIFGGKGDVYVNGKTYMYVLFCGMAPLALEDKAMSTGTSSTDLDACRLKKENKVQRERREKRREKRREHEFRNRCIPPCIDIILINILNT